MQPLLQGIWSHSELQDCVINWEKKLSGYSRALTTTERKEGLLETSAERKEAVLWDKQIAGREQVRYGWR